MCLGLFLESKVSGVECCAEILKYNLHFMLIAVSNLIGALQLKYESFLLSHPSAFQYEANFPTAVRLSIDNSHRHKGDRSHGSTQRSTGVWQDVMAATLAVIAAHAVGPTRSTTAFRSTCVILRHNPQRPLYRVQSALSCSIRSTDPRARPTQQRHVSVTLLRSSRQTHTSVSSKPTQTPKHQPLSLALQSRPFSTHHPSRLPSSPPPPHPPAQPLKTIIPSLTPHENIYTLPNALTFTRLLCAPAIGYFILHTQPLFTLLTFTYAGLTDLLDGYLARRYNQFTVVGSVIDPMADKTLMAISVLALGYTSALPWWFVVIIFCRAFFLAISAIYWRWISLPPPKTMRRYWDFSLPSAEVRPTEISKINTLLQLCLVGCVMVLPVLPGWMVVSGNLSGVVEGWMWMVAGTTVWSGLSYVGNKEAVRVLSQMEVSEKLEEREQKMGGQKLEEQK